MASKSAKSNDEIEKKQSQVAKEILITIAKEMGKQPSDF